MRNLKNNYQILDTMEDEDWRDVIAITYNVVLEQLDRGRAFDTTLSNTLNIGGQYQVKIIFQSS